MKVPKRDVDVVIIRHGKTALNSGNETSVDRERGWADVPLTPEGVKQAQKTGEELKSEGIQAMASSDLKRTTDTAHIIGNKIGINNFKSTMGFRPWDLGDLTGKSTEESKPKRLYYTQHPDVKVPGGESLNDFKKRLFTELRQFVDENRGKKLAIVTHHRVERLLAAWDKKGQPSDFSIDTPTFMDEGEPPSGFDKLKIDERKLGSGSDQAIIKSMKSQGLYGQDQLSTAETNEDKRY